MKTTKIILKGYQTIPNILEAFCTSGSYGTEVLQIMPGEGWQGLIITATFHSPDGSAARMLVGSDGMVEVPSEATASAGTGKIVFAGVEDDVQRISCNVLYRVSEHATVDGGEPQPPTPGVVEQVLAKTAGDRAAAEQAAKKAQEATVNTPKLSANQTWMIWDADAGAYKDTGVYSGGEAPQIGENGNWVIGGQDTGVSARGPRGEPGPQGQPGPMGPAGPQGPAGDNTAALKAAQEANAAAAAANKAAAEAQAVVDTVMPDVNQLKDDKLDKPATPPTAAGKVLRVLSVNKDGTFTCEWADAPSGGGITSIKIPTVNNSFKFLDIVDGVVSLPVGNRTVGVVRISEQSGLYIEDVYKSVRLEKVSDAVFTNRNRHYAVCVDQMDNALRYAMCDGVGDAWTDAQRIAALLRMGCTVDDNGFVKWTAQEVTE